MTTQHGSGRASRNGDLRVQAARPAGAIRHRRSLACALAAALAILAFGVATAQATVIHTYEPVASEAISKGVPKGCVVSPAPPEAEPPCISGFFGNLNGMALTSSHRLVIGEGLETASGQVSRLDGFDGSSGAFESQLAHYGKEVGGLGLSSVAVAGSGVIFAGAGETPSSGPAASVVGLFGPLGEPLKRWTGAGTPAHVFRSVSDVAVNNDTNEVLDSAAGDVYVPGFGEEHGVAQEPVVDVFAAPAAPEYKEVFLAQLTGTCANVGEVATGGAGACSGKGVVAFTRPRRVAVDPANGVLLVADAKAVDIFKPVPGFPGTYDFEGQITETSSGPFSSGINGLAVDEAGDVYVAEEAASVVDEFALSPTGESASYLGHVTGTGEEEGSFNNVVSVAVDPQNGVLYVGDEGVERNRVDVFSGNAVVPFVEAKPATDETASSATLNGEVNPENQGKTTCTFIYGTSRSELTKEAECKGLGSKATPIPNGTSKEPVSAEVTGLAPDTTYYYRLQATNEAGQTNIGEAGEDKEFKTLGPGVLASVTDVASTSATFNGSANPDGAPTSAYIQYGECSSVGACSTSAYEHDVPAAPGEALGEGTEAVELQARHVQGLSPGRTYHYRVLATSTIAGSTETFAGAEASFTTQSAAGGVLADGRQWEQVSPAAKNGALIRSLNTGGGVFQAANTGDAFTYLANAPTETEPPGYGGGAQIFSLRTPSGWVSKDISPADLVPAGPSIGEGEEYRFFSEDLSRAVIHPFGPFIPCESAQGVAQPCLSREGSEQTSFVRSDFAAGGICEKDCYRPLVTGCPAPGTPCAQEVSEDANVPAGTVFGETGQCPSSVPTAPKPFCGPEFVDATPDASHIIIKPCAPGGLPCHTSLTSTPAPNNGLYEWSAGVPAGEQLRLVSVLPGDEGATAASEPSLGYFDFVTRNAVSTDGSRAFWTARSEVNPAEHHLYMRYNATGPQSPLGASGECLDSEDACTVRLDVPQPGATATGTANPEFQIASVDGSRVFFKDEQQLTESSGALDGKADLYECAIVPNPATGELECKLTDLTPLHGKEPGDVQGPVIGASENGCDTASTEGCYVYFVANGRMTNNGVPVAGAVRGDCATEQSPNPSHRCNLYVLHNGTVGLVTVLSGADSPDWAKGGTNLATLTSRVSPNGERLVFMSQLPLTGYDNRDARSGQPDQEVFEYDAATARTACVSCDPSGARPVGAEYHSVVLNAGDLVWEAGTWLAGMVPGWTEYALDTSRYQPRYLSESGRVFFESRDALVPGDVNEAWDVYEWEPVGVGSCREGATGYEPATGGCVSLISSGKSPQESEFMDASETGGDVFFLTSSQLVKGDYDTLYDVYDAHECTTEAPCLPEPSSPPPPCETEASCKASPTPQPGIYGPPASATFSGPGNLTPPPPVKPKPPTAAELRAKHLKAALATCKRKYKHNKHKRQSCEQTAHKRYGAVKKASARNSTASKARAGHR